MLVFHRAWTIATRSDEPEMAQSISRKGLLGRRDQMVRLAYRHALELLLDLLLRS